MKSITNEYKSVYKYLIMIFGLYVIGDYTTTFIAVEFTTLGIKGELNPIAVMLYTNYGSISLLIVKIIIFVVLSIMALKMVKSIKFKSTIMRTLIIIVILSVIVVAVNIYSILSTF